MKVTVPGAKRSRMALIGILAVLVPLVFLLGLQYIWLRRLEGASAVARQATLKNYIETVGQSVEYQYRSLAERLLNLSPELFTTGSLQKAAKHWSLRPCEEARRLFLVDFTRTETGNFLVYHPEDQSLRTPPSSDESLAMILASAPWQLRRFQSAGGGPSTLRVDEVDPSHRILLNAIAGDSGEVVGIAGMILDEDFFRTKLLPRTLDKALHGLFPNYRQDDIAVTVRDGQDALVLGNELDIPPTESVFGNFLFVFTDWRLGLHRLSSAPEAWARTNTALNMLLSVLLAAVLLGGIAFSLRAADRAVRLSEMKSDFVSNVSHELRTPLASIRVFAEFLRTGRARSPERIQEYGEIIEAESRRLSRLIDNILDFSRIESGRKSYQFVETDLAALVEDAVANFRLRTNAKGFQIEYAGPEEAPPPLLLDDDAIGRSLDNLLENAVKYSGDARWIAVRLGVLENEVTIAVEDRGLGIPRDEQERIFDRFHRAGRGLVHDVKGSGLGLAIVHHVVQAHGGSVTVVSEIGRGSIFTLHLPVAPRNSRGPKS